ncbi:hypothetical protein M441DRAFT_56878 [Trichoderma asperellum CBS 433.97]|uniref:Uncharacterized protein n=1 Tax=Trichoderma asperellum (strain ATCC 204424 / CBS 433.97 / NBRC 101777) TaxID=1042311 RepID=A0A2T3ZB93_TRIA4|nr:hypothetical protein M441DRAFT_56878 [Trichoderma asperellum CBS 433.97]PTB42081.1 hypothetical protein M441DRAFT_56878 [Trichoderma asperellum CBS 433.97]
MQYLLEIDAMTASRGVEKYGVHSICTEALQKPHRIARLAWRRPIPRSLAQPLVSSSPPMPADSRVYPCPRPSPPLLIRSELAVVSLPR